MGYETSVRSKTTYPTKRKCNYVEVKPLLLTPIQNINILNILGNKCENSENKQCPIEQ